MADEQKHGRDPAHGASEPDDTRQFSPFDDDGQADPPGNHPDGGPRSGDDDLAGTQQMPATPGGPEPPDDATAIVPPASEDATVVTPQPPRRDDTAVMPTQSWDEDADAVWAGRAPVRPPRAGSPTTTDDWTVAAPPEPRGKWWMPIVVGIVALVLLGLLGWGIYLIAQNSGTEETPPAVTPSAAPPASTAPTTTEPTTTPPTTPTTTDPTGPTEVTVPALVGLSREEAQQALDRSGLSYRVIFRPSDAAAGTVIDSDPPEGQEVPPDTQVTLVVAAQRTTTATPPTSTTETDEPDGD